MILTTEQLENLKYMSEDPRFLNFAATQLMFRKSLNPRNKIIGAEFTGLEIICVQNTLKVCAQFNMISDNSESLEFTIPVSM